MNDIFNIDLDEYEDAISDCLDRLNKWRPQDDPDVERLYSLFLKKLHSIGCSSKGITRIKKVQHDRRSLHRLADSLPR